MMPMGTRNAIVIAVVNGMEDRVAYVLSPGIAVKKIEVFGIDGILLCVDVLMGR